MPTNPNMVAIQTVTVGSGGAASITFSSIPQTYTDLKIVASLRNNSTADYISISFNGSTSTFTSRYLTGLGSSGVSSGSRSDSLASATAVPSDWTASTFSNFELYIPNYTSNTNKSWSSDTALEQNNSYSVMQLIAGLWSTTSAITSISLSGTSALAQYSTATLYGVTSSAYGAKATGGIITSDNTYWYHTFLASDTFTPTSNITADYLVVAGGGSGGSWIGGGGGAGGLRCTVGATGGGGSLESALSFTASTAYTITVGGGGASVAVQSTQGNSGSNSSISGTGITTVTSTGGGGGGAYNALAGKNGGAGGGGGYGAAGGTGTTNQGYAGGTAVGAVNFCSAGGGGAGAAGSNAPTSGTNNGGNGGNGVATSISGISVTYAGGGGGGTNNAFDGSGGSGGGGAAGFSSGTAGTANTGGGGGGASNSGTAPSGSGGSGIVIVRYAK